MGALAFECVRVRVCTCICENGSPIHSDNISDQKQAFSQIFEIHVIDGQMDGRTNKRTDGRTDGWTGPLAEKYGRI